MGRSNVELTLVTRLKGMEDIRQMPRQTRVYQAEIHIDVGSFDRRNPRSERY